jgi:hypothetical protein
MRESRPDTMERSPDSPSAAYLRGVMFESLERYQKMASRRQLTAEELRSVKTCQRHIAMMDGEARSAYPSPTHANPRDDYKRRADALQRRMHAARLAQMRRG